MIELCRKKVSGGSPGEQNKYLLKNNWRCGPWGSCFEHDAKLTAHASNAG